MLPLEDRRISERSSPQPSRAWHHAGRWSPTARLIGLPEARLHVPPVQGTARQRKPPDDTLVWFAPSVVMNPKLPQHIVDRALAENAPKGAHQSQARRQTLSGVGPARAQGWVSGVWAIA
jgi:hypothetical protein